MKIFGIGAELMAKRYFNFPDLDMEHISESLEFTAGIEVTENFILGLEAKGTKNYKGEYSESYVEPKINIFKIVNIGKTDDTEDFILPITLEAYLIVGGQINVNINVSEFSRRLSTSKIYEKRIVDEKIMNPSDAERKLGDV